MQNMVLMLVVECGDVSRACWWWCECDALHKREHSSNCTRWNIDVEQQGVSLYVCVCVCDLLDKHTETAWNLPENTVNGETSQTPTNCPWSVCSCSC